MAAGKSRKGPAIGGKGLLRIAFWVALAVVAVLAVRAIVADEDSAEPSGEAEIVSIDELRETASSAEQPIYWAGIQTDTELELSQPDGERTYVRYLTGDAEAGEANSDFLTIGTYVFPDATAALERLSKKPGGVSASAPAGGVVYFNRAKPQSIYLAFPGEDVQIEVYDTDPKRALGLVTSGRIVPAG